VLDHEVVRRRVLIYQGQPHHIINDKNGPWETTAQCERWLASQPHSSDVDLSKLGYENLVYGCKLIGE
jgi:hypothetical protein